MAQPSRDPSLPPRLLFRMCFAFTSRAWSTRAPLEREQRRFSAFTLSPAALSATPGPPACPATEADGARRPRAQPSQSSGRAPKKKAGSDFSHSAAAPQGGQRRRARTPHSRRPPHPWRQRSPSPPLPQHRHLNPQHRPSAGGRCPGELREL